MGRPRKHKDDAAKAKAYRERKKAARLGVTKGQTALVQRVMAAEEDHVRASAAARQG